MYTHVQGRFVLVCLSLGLSVLLAACTDATPKSSELSNMTATTFQGATPTLSATAPSKVYSQTPTSVPIVQTTAVIPTPTPAPVQSTPQPTITTVVNVPKPTATPSPEPTDQTGPLTLTFGCSGPDAQDGVHVTNTNAKVCVYTAVSAASLTISAVFCNNQPDPSGALQGTFTSNSHGFYEWDWTPQPSCRPISKWRVNVSAQWNGQYASVSRSSSMVG